MRFSELRADKSDHAEVISVLCLSKTNNPGEEQITPL
jgi:hypothetical protein